MEGNKDMTKDKIILKIFITGNTPRSEKALSNLNSICEEELKGRYELAIIDVLERPHMAEEEKIIATPTVIKLMPLPAKRIIGDLSDKKNVLLNLDIISNETELI